MTVIGPNSKLGPVRKATAAEADAARPKGLPKDREGIVLGTGEIAFRVYGGPFGAETEAVLKGMAEDWDNLPEGLRPGSVVGPRVYPKARRAAKRRDEWSDL